MRLSSASQQLLCRYTNATSRIQIVKIFNIGDRFFERTVMPQTTIIFEAHEEASLEVHTSEMMSAILSDTIPCSQLDVGSSLGELSALKEPVMAASADSDRIG